MAEPNRANGQSLKDGGSQGTAPRDAAAADHGTTSDPVTTADGPNGANGQSANHQQTTVTGPEKTTATGPGDASDSFFDPKEIIGTPLEPGYKQMQAAFSRKSAELKSLLTDNQNKVNAYDEFMRNPEENLQNLARQVGYSLVKGQPEQQGDWQPKTWNEVVEKIRSETREELMQEIQPVMGEVNKLRKQSVEQQLDASFEDWRHYEDEMMENLVKHPTLVNDPGQLYRMTVPPEVLEQRAMKQAMQKLQGRGDGGPSGPATSTATETKDNGLSDVRNFSDAVNYARNQLQQRGIKRPSS